jgi:hypothetical protein
VTVRQTDIFKKDRANLRGGDDNKPDRG